MRSIRNCPVAVIGGAGFLGSHVVNHLINERRCDVLVVDNLCVGRREFVHGKARFFHHDISTSEEFLRHLFEREKVRYVMNYVAWPYIPDSFSRPKHVFSVNASGAINVINAAQEAGAEGVLQISSAEIYGRSGGDLGFGSAGSWENYRLTEDSEVLPHSTYGAAKAAADYYCQTAWRERRTPVIALRQFNCLGERETHPYVVPEIISQLDVHSRFYNPTPMIRLGNNSFRDFLYAGDQARLAVELLEAGQWGEVYNLGSEGGVKVYDLAKLIGQVMGFADVAVEPDESRKRPWEIWHLQSDNSKLYSAIGYRPQLVTLEESLRRTVKWYNDSGRKWPWQ